LGGGNPVNRCSNASSNSSHRFVVSWFLAASAIRAQLVALSCEIAGLRSRCQGKTAADSASHTRLTNTPAAYALANGQIAQIKAVGCHPSGRPRENHHQYSRASRVGS
jgi:hypothetical protein